MPKLLAIDDKMDNLVTLSALLKNLIPGCEVITALSGVAGIEMAESESPDTILLDVKMPDMDGFETCRRLKYDERTKHIPVIMITAIKTDSQSRIKGLEIGADAFLAKPIDPYELVSQLNVALRIKKAEDALREERDALEHLVEERTEALRNREEYFRSLVESTSDWIWATDAEGRYMYASPQVEDFLGYKSEEIMGKTPFDFMPPKEAARVKNIFQEFSNARRPFKGIENLNIGKNGGTVVLETSGVPIFDEAGNFDGYHGVDRDITERKITEEALKTSEAKYRSMMEAMVDPAYICSKDFRVEYMNPAMINRLGRDATGERCHSAMHELDGKCPWCVHEKVMGGESVRVEIVSPKDNKTFHVSNSPLSNTPGSISKLTVFRDITEIKKMEEKFRQVQKMESIGTLAGGIAHDFNNMLFPLLGFAELLKEDIQADSPLQNHIDEIILAALRSKELVQQILVLGRKGDQTVKPIKLHAILKEALNLLRASIPTTIDIQKDIDSKCGIVMADPTQIHQIVMNLATNAYHAMEDDGGRLDVSLKQVAVTAVTYEQNISDMHTLTPGNYALLTVSDTGTGIEKENLDRIFDPYFTTKRVGKGTGLGLAVVQGIVKTHKGDVHVVSEPGKGTSVRVYLPIKERSVEHIDIKEDQPIPMGTETILLVDDEAPIVRMEQQMLERLGYKVTPCTGSLEAIEAFKGDPGFYDLVITDMTMPHMPGDRLAEKLISIRPDIPVIICTGYSEKISEEKVKQIGIRGFLLKPMVKSDLARMVRNVLDLNRQES